jgi:hypothetical protein
VTKVAGDGAVSARGHRLATATGATASGHYPTTSATAHPPAATCPTTRVIALLSDSYVLY